MNKRRRWKAKARRKIAAWRHRPLRPGEVFTFSSFYFQPRHEDCDCMGCRPWAY